MIQHATVYNINSRHVYRQRCFGRLVERGQHSSLTRCSLILKSGTSVMSEAKIKCGRGGGQIDLTDKMCFEKRDCIRGLRNSVVDP